MPHLSRLPQSLDPSPFPATLRYRIPGTASATALPDWWRGFKAPLIYVPIGTVPYVSIAADAYATVLRALEEFPQTRAHVHVGPWVDRSDVMEEADVVLRHRGSETVFAALGAGIPLVIVPLFADQFENGRRVQGVRSGLTVEDSREGPSGPRRFAGSLDPVRISSAVSSVITKSLFRERGRRVASEMASASTADEVLATCWPGTPRPRSFDAQ